MQVTLNSLNLMTGNYALDEIQFDSSPPLEFSDLSFASADGAKFISSKYTPKTLTMRGRITQSTVALLEAEMDNFKKTLLKDPNINLNFSYANSFRQYVGNVQNLILSRKNFHITYVPFEITFIAEDPPFAYDISSLSQLTPNLSEVFSADGIVGNTYSHTLTMSGTAPPLAKWTYLLDSVSGRMDQLIFKSITTGKQLELNAALSAGDELVIDQENLQVLLNGFNQNYEGVFPIFNLGGNELELKVYGTAGVGGGGMYLDQSMIAYTFPFQMSGSSGFTFGQTFVAGYTGSFSRVSIVLKKGSTANISTITARLYSVSSGMPNTLLATGSTLNSSILNSDFSWYDFDFSGYSVTAGTSYAVVFDYSVTVADTYVAFALGYRSDGSLYSNGAFVYHFAGSSIWYTFNGDDMAFKTYITASGVSTPFDHTSSLKVEQKKRFL